jgi:hypothetical protein
MMYSNLHAVVYSPATKTWVAVGTSINYVQKYRFCSVHLICIDHSNKSNDGLNWNAIAAKDLPRKFDVAKYDDVALDTNTMLQPQTKHKMPAMLDR